MEIDFLMFPFEPITSVEDNQQEYINFIHIILLGVPAYL